jgi:cysteine desulfurase
VAREAGVLFHCDAAQSVGKIPVDVAALGIDLLACTAHKLYGPKGCGILYVRGRHTPGTTAGSARVRLAAQMHGGGHERGLRSGTLNVPGAVGFGRACAIAAEEMDAEAARIYALRERLHRGLVDALGDLRLNGHPTARLPGNLNVSFAGAEADSLLAALPDVALSSGSACTSATLEPSHVLRAIGLEDEAAHSSIRFGLGRFTTEPDVDYAIGRVAHEVRRLRALSPRYAAASAARSSGAAREPAAGRQ